MPAAILKSLAIWAAFISIAVLNGIGRETCFVPLLGPRLALPLSGITGALLFFLLTWFTLPRIGPLRPALCWWIGLAWLTLTILFECLFGRLVAGKSWTELLGAYDITGGNLWLLVLLVITVAPYAVARLRGLIP